MICVFLKKKWINVKKRYNTTIGKELKQYILNRITIYKFKWNFEFSFIFI